MSTDPVAEEAAALLRQGENQRAIALLIARPSLSVEAMHYLCDAYFQSRDWPKAHEILQALLTAGFRTPYNLRLDAKILANMGRHREALDSALVFLKDHEDDLESIGTAKICCWFLNDVEAAVAYGQRALVAKDRQAGASPTDAGSMRPNEEGRRVISYSVWGDNRAYLLGAAINARLAARYFPDWLVRIYADSGLAPDVVRLYERLGVELIFADRDFPDVPRYFWRFLAADDEDGRIFLSRDADSRLSAAEARLVDEWLQSGKRFHVIRDHVLHDELVLAGLWGGVASRDLAMRERIRRYFLSLPSRAPSHKYGHDQRFLGGSLWPLLRPSVFVHDRFYKTQGVDSHRHAFDVSFGAGHTDARAVTEEAAALGLVID
jgi:tetratricopeptide (TPR) repeat protein